MHDLLCKLISVKGILAISSFVFFALNNTNEFAFVAMMVFCSLLVVGREYQKYLEILKILKGRG